MISVNWVKNPWIEYLIVNWLIYGHSSDEISQFASGSVQTKYDLKHFQSRLFG